MSPTTRWTLPALAWLGLLVAPALAIGETVTEKSAQVLDARGLAELAVDNARGPVQVRPSADGRLHLTLWKVCRAENQAHAEQLARETIVHVDRSGDRVTVQVDYPRRIDVRLNFWDLISHDGLSSDHLPNAEVRAFIEAPAGAALRVSSVSGDLDVAGLSGHQRLHTTSGDVTVHDLAGPLELETVSGDVVASSVARSRVHSVSGDIEVSDARGALEIETTSGELTVSGASDSLRLRSTSGDMTVSRAPRGLDAGTASGELVASQVRGAVRVRTASGDVRVGLDPAFGDAEIRTTSGSVQVSLAPGSSAILDLRTTSGQLSCDVPARLETTSRRSLSGVVGRGGHTIRLGSVSGDLTVTSGGQ